MKTRHGVIWLVAAHALLVPFAGGALGWPGWVEIACAGVGLLAMIWCAQQAWAHGKATEAEHEAAMADFERRRREMLRRLQTRAEDVPLTVPPGTDLRMDASRQRQERLRSLWDADEVREMQEAVTGRMQERLEELGATAEDAAAQVFIFAEQCGSGMHCMDAYGQMDYRDGLLRRLASEWGTAARRIQALEAGAAAVRWVRERKGGAA
jgi:hypothetical protein